MKYLRVGLFSFKIINYFDIKYKFNLLSFKCIPGITEFKISIILFDFY